MLYVLHQERRRPVILCEVPILEATNDSRGVSGECKNAQI